MVSAATLSTTMRPSPVVVPRTADPLRPGRGWDNACGGLDAESGTDHAPVGLRGVGFAECVTPVDHPGSQAPGDAVDVVGAVAVRLGRMPSPVGDEDQEFGRRRRTGKLVGRDHHTGHLDRLRSGARHGIGAAFAVGGGGGHRQRIPGQVDDRDRLRRALVGVQGRVVDTGDAAAHPDDRARQCDRPWPDDAGIRRRCRRHGRGGAGLGRGRLGGARRGVGVAASGRQHRCDEEDRSADRGAIHVGGTTANTDWFPRRTTVARRARRRGAR